MSPPAGDASGFESQSWKVAVCEFRTNSQHDVERLDRFLLQNMSPHDVEKVCREKQRDCGSEYSPVLNKILSKVDIFVNAGNLAVKAAPESIGLAWTGISLTLNALSDDYQTFQVFGTACADIMSILLTCRLFTSMFAETQGPDQFLEIQRKVIDEVPAVYGQVLEFSYQMFKTSEESKYLRIAKSLLRKNKVKFEGSLQGLKNGEKALSDYATKAHQALSRYYDVKSDLAQTRLENIKASLESSKADSRELQNLMEQLEKLKARTPMDVASETYKKQLKQLNLTVDLEFARDQRIGKRDEGTCQWIYNVPEFKKWRESPTSSLLLVYGRGNSGKSTLVSSVIAGLEANATEDESVLVHYFFCRNGDDHAQLTDRILDQILCILYRKAPTELDGLNKCNELIQSYLPKTGAGIIGERKKNDTRATFEKTYAEVARVLGKSSITIIIDALDECSDRQQADFIERMKRLVAHENVTIKVFISSRPEGDILKGFSGVAQINIEKHNEGDISQVVKKKLKEIPGLSPPEIMEAYKEITKRADSFFGYIEPALDTLRKPWKRPLSEHLNSLPQDIINMNAQIFQRIDPAYVEFLRTCLTWTILANGNQKVLVDEIIDIYSGVYLYDESDWTGKDLDAQQLQFYESQISLCGSAFMEVDMNSREISLIKPAIVKDSFLVEEPQEPEESQKSSELNVCAECAQKRDSPAGFSLTKRDGHLEIALTIFKHLNSPIFCQRFLKEFDDKGDSHSSEEARSGSNDNGNDDAETILVREDLISASESSKMDDLQNSAEQVLEKQAEPSSDPAIETEDSTAHQDDSAGTVTGAATGAVAEGQSNGEVEAPPRLQRFDTFPANVQEGSVSDADSDYQDDDLIEAADFGKHEGAKTRYELKQCLYHLQQVEELWGHIENKPAAWNELWREVEKFFNQDSTYFQTWARRSLVGFSDSAAFSDLESYNITPLHFMADAGIIEGTRRFLGRGDQVDAPTKYGRVPLHGAAILDEKETQIEVCRLLLNAGANPNFTKSGGYCDSPLAWLLYNKSSNVEAVQLFLAHGARADSRSSDTWTMLENFAASGTDPAIVGILIDAGVEINAKDEDGETALHKLVARSDVSEEMVEAFFAAGAHVNAEDNESQQPMYECAKHGKLETIKVLLRHGAEIEDLDDQDWTALSRAAFHGRAEIARVLVESGAEIGRLDKLGRTLFYLACQSGDMETIRYFADLFKEKGKTDVYDRPAADGKTPFRKACANAAVELPRFLLKELGVPIEVDAEDNKFGRTALHVAAHRGLEDVVNLLISHGADARLVDNQEKTALKLAYENWPLAQANNSKGGQYENVICRLIDLDRRAAIEDLELLHIAAARGSLQVLRKLIHDQPSADLTRRDEHGWDALDHARQWRTKDAEVLLNEKGVVGKRPSAWVSTSPQRIVVSEDGLSIWQAAEAKQMQPKTNARHTVFSDHPIPSRSDKFYFEITISDQDAKLEKMDHRREISFGVSQRTQNETRRKDWVPGLPSSRGPKFNSWGWHGDDGFSCRTLGSPQSTKIDEYNPGDTVGCAVDYTSGTIFFTKNGKRLGEKTWSDVGGRLYCCVGISDPIKATANFQGPFVWEKGNTLDFEFTEAELTTSPTN